MFEHGGEADYLSREAPMLLKPVPVSVPSALEQVISHMNVLVAFSIYIFESEQFAALA